MVYKSCIVCDGGYKVKKSKKSKVKKSKKYKVKKSKKSLEWWVYWLDTVTLVLLIIADFFKKYYGIVTEYDKLLLMVNCMIWVILTIMFDNFRSINKK